MPVKLSSLQSDQIEKLHRWRNDEELAHLLMSTSRSQSKEDVKIWLEKTLCDQNQKVLGIYAMTGSSQELIGLVRFMYIDWGDRRADLGIFVGDSELRGQGHGKAALGQALAHASEALGLKHLLLKVVECNHQAFGLYESFGFNVSSVEDAAYPHGDQQERVYSMVLDLP